MKTSISLVFATYNGELTLPSMLARLGEVDLHDIELRILAVDNGSTDRTPDILQLASRSIRGFNHFRHEARGKNRCLNAALQMVDSELVVFTDDDVLPARDWLQELRSAATRHTDYDIFGGAIQPVWPTDPPEWIMRAVPLGSVFGLTDENLNSGPASPESIWGANMMVRSSVFASGMRFNDDVGPSQGQYTMGSEIDFNCRAAQAGHKCWITHTAVVGHMIRPYQLEYEWIVARAFRVGRGDYVRRHRLHGQPRPELILPMWRWRSFFRTMAERTLGAGFRRTPEERIKLDWEYNYMRGWIAAGWSDRGKN